MLFHFHHDSENIVCVSRADPLRSVCLSDWRAEEVSPPWLESRDFWPRKQGCSKTGGWFSEWEKSAALPFSCRSKTAEVREKEPRRPPACREPTSTGSHYRSEDFFLQQEIQYVVKERRTNTLLMDLSRFFGYLYCTWVFFFSFNFCSLQISVLYISYTGKNTLVINIKSYYWSILTVVFCSLQRKIPIFWSKV